MTAIPMPPVPTLQVDLTVLALMAIRVDCNVMVCMFSMDHR